MIEFIQIGKSYKANGKKGNNGDFRAIDNIDLRIADNEFITILGPSGCGKTTLLRILAGLVDDYDGEVRVRGNTIDGPDPSRAMVFQSFALLPWATVTRNVAFGLELAGMGLKERTEIARKYISLVGLDGFEGSLPKELSGGMRQRVGIARALAGEPEVLLMDEPFGALDEQTKLTMQDELVSIWEKTRKTVVFVTHSIDEAIFLADRVIVMQSRPGRIVHVEDVDLDRPRRREDLLTPKFAAMKERVWEKLKGDHV